MLLSLLLIHLLKPEQQCSHIQQQEQQKKSLASERGKKALFDRNNIRHHGGSSPTASANGRRRAASQPFRRRGWRTSFSGGHRTGINHASASPSEMIRSLAVEWSCVLRQNENNSERAPGSRIARYIHILLRYIYYSAGNPCRVSARVKRTGSDSLCKSDSSIIVSAL